MPVQTMSYVRSPSAQARVVQMPQTMPLRATSPSMAGRSLNYLGGATAMEMHATTQPLRSMSPQGIGSPRSLPQNLLHDGVDSAMHSGMLSGVPMPSMSLSAVPGVVAGPARASSPRPATMSLSAVPGVVSGQFAPLARSASPLQGSLRSVPGFSPANSQAGSLSVGLPQLSGVPAISNSSSINHGQPMQGPRAGSSS